MSTILTERFLRRALIVIALGGLIFGLLAWAAGRADVANWIWAAGTAPVVIGLLVSMIRDLLAGRMGVDAIAFVSMSAALVLGENLAGAVVAVMYAGGNVLEDFAVARAERDLKSLIDRAPGLRTAGRDPRLRISRSSKSRSATLYLCAPARSSRSTGSSSVPVR